VALIGIVSSGVFAVQLYGLAETQDRQEFAAMVAQFDRRLNDEFSALRLIATLGQGLAAMDKDISRGDWRNFVSGLDWRRMPGALAFGFVERTTRAEMEAYVKRAQALGAQDFAVRSIDGGEARGSELYLWRLAEPADAQRQLVGLDLATQPQLKGILDWSMLSGSAGLSDPIAFGNLLGLRGAEANQTGILMAAPVYEHGAAPASFEERKATLVGWIVMPISVAAVSQAALRDLSEGIDVDVYLGAARREDRRLFHSDGTAQGAKTAPQNQKPRATTMVLAGQSLTIDHRMRSAEDWTAGIMPPLVMLGGSVISTLLGISLWFMVAARFRAEERARVMTRDLYQEKERAEEARRIAEEWRLAAEKHANEMEMSRASLEIQATETVQLAEELALQKAEAEREREKSEFLASHDVLTGLPNRRALLERLHTVFDSAPVKGVGLLFIDLDKFKEVNDTLGHDAGDDLLIKVADKLRSILRGSDYVARLGGDEFAFLLTGDVAQIGEAAASVGKRVLQNLQIVVPSPKGGIQIGCTVGAAVSPQDAQNAQQIMTFSDQLMYFGKKQGRNRVITSADMRLAR
jgi:diguanylate cyclase (GGDEF)-like protein